jgi:hypothetical protein
MLQHLRSGLLYSRKDDRHFIKILLQKCHLLPS